MRLSATFMALVAATSPAFAQHQHSQSPYAGLQERSVKALTEQQLSDLRSGRGMGLALAAELNGYPGPLHVLELANQLGLTDEQRHHMGELVAAMKTEAIPAGEKLIVHEQALDQAFAARAISPASLAELTARIGAAQGQLRAIHLKYHLATAELLSEHQRSHYAELRGYR